MHELWLPITGITVDASKPKDRFSIGLVMNKIARMSKNMLKNSASDTKHYVKEEYKKPLFLTILISQVQIYLAV